MLPELRRLPGTSLLSSAVGLGTWGLGGPNDLDGLALGWPAVRRPQQVIEAAVKAGITFFDTSDFYGGGRAETLLGETLCGEKGVLIATKVGLLPRLRAGTSDIDRDFSSNHISRAIAESVRRLKRDTLDVVYLHGPDPDLLDDTGIWTTLEELKRTGMIGFVGVSLSRRANKRAVIQKWLNHPIVSIVQCEYSFRHPTYTATIDSAEREGKTLVARSVLGHGLLLHAGNRRQYGVSDHRSHKIKEDETRQILSFFESVAWRRESVRTRLELALRFAMDSPAISVTVVGATSRRQVGEIVSACGALPMDAKERTMIQEAALATFGRE